MSINEEEFWDEVPVFPDRTQEMEDCARFKLSDRKNAFFEDITKREKFERTNASQEIGNSLNDRKKAFFVDVNRRESTTSSLSDEGPLSPQTSLDGRKNAFFEDKKIRDEAVFKENASLDIEKESSLKDRKNAFFEDKKIRDEAIQRRDAKNEIQNDSLKERKKAFFDDVNQREQFSRTDASEGIDKSEISFRRENFCKQDLETNSISNGRRAKLDNSQHKATRRIENPNQLFKLLKERRAKLEPAEEIK